MGRLVHKPVLKFEQVHKEHLMRSRAGLCNAAEAMSSFMAEFGVEDTPETRKWLLQRVKYYWYHPKARQWQEQIEPLREQWRNGLADDIRLANKRARVEELAKEYNAIPDSTPILSKDGDVVGERRNTNAKVKVLEQIRVEMEGKQAAGDGSSDSGLVIQIVNAIGTLGKP